VTAQATATPRSSLGTLARQPGSAWGHSASLSVPDRPALPDQRARDRNTRAPDSPNRAICCGPLAVGYLPGLVPGAPGRSEPWQAMVMVLAICS